MSLQPSVSIFWFRRDLRLHDNKGLFNALQESPAVMPIFIFDTDILSQLPAPNDARITFIYECLQSIQQRCIEYNSSLQVYFGKPIEIFRNLCSHYTISSVYVNKDYEPYGITRDTEIAEFLKTHNITFNSYKDHVIFEHNEVVKKDGTPYTIYTPYSAAWKQKLSNQTLTQYPCEDMLSHLYKSKPTEIPTLESIGFTMNSTCSPTPIIPKNIIQQYHATRDIPGIQGTTRLGIHLRFGTVSIRSMVHIALQFNQTWLNELIWREFFISILYHFPRVEHNNFKSQYDAIAWRNNEFEFEQWCTGNTGYPIVDAGMRELNTTGFMHNRVRMITASFLTKHLLIDWQWGEAYFAQKLLDYELSSNNGNWQWAAGTGCDAAPYFRIFNPYEQTKRFDPQHTYIQTWVPEYSQLNYAKPIVEHAFARKRALEVYGKALKKI